MSWELDAFGTTAAVLAVAAVFAFLAHRARQPLIVAYIVVGVIVGPSVLGWVEDTEALELLAELGIAILLFLVGLKLDIRLVKSIGRVALTTGLGQVVFTSLAGFVLTLAFGFPPIAAAYIAVALTFSSTIIIVKLLSDKRELEELHGRIALGFLIVQDIVVIIAMIVLSTFDAGGADGGEDLLQEIAFTAVAAITLIGGTAAMMRWVLPRLLRVAASSQELLIVGSVAWAVAMATLTEGLGFSVEVGAFLAGFALASTPYRETIASSLSGLRDFMLLFFFIVLGALLDFSAIGSQIPAAIVLSLFVLVGNPLIVLVIMGVMRYPKRVSFLAGLTVAQISEFSLILIALGRELGHVDDSAVGLVTLVGMITIGGSTYLILYSKQIYAVIEPLLGVFERRVRIPVATDPVEGFDVILYGTGRFGRHLLRRLVDAGYRTLVVDWDPHARLRLDDDVAHLAALRFGNANDPAFPETLPLGSARWIVSTIPDAATNKVLAAAVRRSHPTVPIAVTAHTEPEAAAYDPAIAAGHINAVFEPFDDAADDAIDTLRDL